MTRRFVVTGCGRSGTNYMASLLDAAGVRCLHERACTPRQFVGFGGADGDASWFAAAYLDQLPNDVVVVHLVRDPIAVAKSFHRLGLFHRRYRRVPVLDASVWVAVFGGRPTFGRVLSALRHPRRSWRRGVFVADQRALVASNTSAFDIEVLPERYLAYWQQWNELVESNAVGRPYLRLRLEDIDEKRWSELCEFLRIGTRPMPDVPVMNRKERYPARVFELGQLSASVQRAADRYGYQLSEAATALQEPEEDTTRG